MMYCYDYNWNDNANNLFQLAKPFPITIKNRFSSDNRINSGVLRRRYQNQIKDIHIALNENKRCLYAFKPSKGVYGYFLLLRINKNRESTSMFSARGMVHKTIRHMLKAYAEKYFLVVHRVELVLLKEKDICYALHLVTEVVEINDINSEIRKAIIKDFLSDEL